MFFMKIGILGSGIVGRVLGSAFIAEGNEVMLGTRNVQKPEVVKWLAENPGAKAGSFEETAAFAEVIVLAASGDIIADVINAGGLQNFNNKVVIDASNPIDHTKPPVNGVLPYFTTTDHSLMEQLQKLLPDAKLVKAFNSVGNAFMYKPDFGGQKPTMFICGNDAEAKKMVTGILDAFGWETEDMGKVEAARAIEPLCILWCLPGILNNRWTHAFKLLKK
ncbi:MAG: NAD(P)-binding domain-containing protein [Chitinophagaceae bacterium]|nr:NAD(P)-binding domain-containing protein [Chitinophagaceae bacterium]MBK9487002.1 NAD(P)-binding domain-containing protein [Chitinophagaceae bacterium]